MHLSSILRPCRTHRYKSVVGWKKNQEFNCIVEHRPGRLHGNADGLSRKPNAQIDQNVAKVAVTRSNNQNVTEVSPTLNQMASTGQDGNLHDINLAVEQEIDPDIGSIYKALQQSSEPPPWSIILPCSGFTKQLYIVWPLLTMENNILFRRWIGTDKQTK